MRFEELPEIVPGNFDGIDSYCQERFPVIGPTDPKSFFCPEMFFPSGDKPFRMIDNLCARFVPLCLFGKHRFLPNRLTEDAVDEPFKSFWHACCFTAFDHFIDRGRWRDPFKKKQLVESHRNRLVDDRVDFP